MWSFLPSLYFLQTASWNFFLFASILVLCFGFVHLLTKCSSLQLKHCCLPLRKNADSIPVVSLPVHRSCSTISKYFASLSWNRTSKFGTGIVIPVDCNINWSYCWWAYWAKILLNSNIKVVWNTFNNLE